MAPPTPPQTSTGKNSKKKSRKTKGTVLSLQAFLSPDDNKAGPSTHVLKKLKNSSDWDSDESTNSVVVYELPTVPLCERGQHEREMMPQTSKKKERFNEHEWSDWRSGISSNATSAKPTTEMPTSSSAATYGERKQNDRYRLTKKESTNDLTSWRSSVAAGSKMGSDGRPKLQLQPRSLPLPTIVQLPELPESTQRHATPPEPVDIKVTIKKRLIDERDRHGEGLSDADADPMQRIHNYVSTEGNAEGRGSPNTNWRTRDQHGVTMKPEEADVDDNRRQDKADDEEVIENGAHKKKMQIPPMSNDSSEA